MEGQCGLCLFLYVYPRGWSWSIQPASYPSTSLPRLRSLNLLFTPCLQLNKSRSTYLPRFVNRYLITGTRVSDVEHHIPCRGRNVTVITVKDGEINTREDLRITCPM